MGVSVDCMHRQKEQDWTASIMGLATTCLTTTLTADLSAGGRILLFFQILPWFIRKSSLKHNLPGIYLGVRRDIIYFGRIPFFWAHYNTQYHIERWNNERGARHCHVSMRREIWRSADFWTMIAPASSRDHWCSDWVFFFFFGWKYFLKESTD